METAVNFERLCPTVREAGFQRGDFWQIPRRIYDHQMMLCLSGSALLTLANRTYRLRQKYLAIIPPDTPHTLHYGDDAAELVWIHFDFFPEDDGDWIYRWYNTPENYIHCFAPRLPFPEHIRSIPVFPGNYRLPPVIAFDDNSDVESLFLSLAKAYPWEQNHFMLSSRIAVMRVLDEILDQDGYWQHSEPIRVSDLIVQFIKFNYMNRISMKDICACTQYNFDYAGKLFRRETGRSVISYLNQFRINKARTLLMDETLSIAAIAEMCGFQSINYFSKVTRKLTGKSPRELRSYLLTIKNESIASK